MSLAGIQQAIRSRGTAVPTHTAAQGTLYLRTTDNTVWEQTAAPTGVVWVMLGPKPGTGSFEVTPVVVNTGPTGSYEQV